MNHGTCPDCAQPHPCPCDARFAVASRAPVSPQPPTRTITTVDTGEAVAVVVIDVPDWSWDAIAPALTDDRHLIVGGPVYVTAGGLLPGIGVHATPLTIDVRGCPAMGALRQARDYAREHKYPASVAFAIAIAHLVADARGVLRPVLAVCPACTGDGREGRCSLCSGEGWVGRDSADAIAEGARTATDAVAMYEAYPIRCVSAGERAEAEHIVAVWRERAAAWSAAHAALTVEPAATTPTGDTP